MNRRGFFKGLFALAACKFLQPLKWFKKSKGYGYFIAEFKHAQLPLKHGYSFIIFHRREHPDWGNAAVTERIKSDEGIYS